MDKEVFIILCSPILVLIFFDIIAGNTRTYGPATATTLALYVVTGICLIGYIIDKKYYSDDYDEKRIYLAISGIIIPIVAFLIYYGINNYESRMALDGYNAAAFDASISPIVLGIIILIIYLRYSASLLINWKKQQ